MLCDIVQADRTLMFSSDYPHWDFDSPAARADGAARRIRQRVRVDNAVETFGPRL